jgi:hypothetical protein
LGGNSHRSRAILLAATKSPFFWTRRGCDPIAAFIAFATGSCTSVKAATSAQPRLSDIDIERCPRCGARLKIIAAIVDPQIIIKILTHLGLPARAPPRTPARPFPLFQAA